MDALDVALRAGVVLFMVGSLGGIGLGLAPRDALAPLTHGRFVALTLGVCSRNLGAALGPLATIDPDPRAVVMIAIAAPVTLVLSALTARWLARRSRALSVAFTAGSA